MSQIKVLPFIAIFNESAVIDHMVGFEDLGNNVRRSTPFIALCYHSFSTQLDLCALNYCYIIGCSQCGSAG